MLRALILISLLFICLGSEALEPRLCAWSLTKSGPSLAQEALEDFNFPQTANISPKFNSRVRRIIYDVFEGKDYYSGLPIRYHEMTIDHVIPLSLGGLDNAFNFVPTVRKINQEKGNSFILSRDIEALIELRDNYGPKLVKAFEKEGLFQAYLNRPNQRDGANQSQRNQRFTQTQIPLLAPLIRVHFDYESDQILEFLASLREPILQGEETIFIDSRLFQDEIRMLESLQASIVIVSTDGRERTDTIVDLVYVNYDFSSSFAEITLHPFIFNQLRLTLASAEPNQQLEVFKDSFSPRELTREEMNELLDFDF